MTNKIFDMKNVLKIVLAGAIMLVVAACGKGVKETKSELTEKKVKLEKLTGERSKLDAEIKKLQEEIAKVDTSANMNKGILVAAVPVAEQAFDHYIKLQGHV